MCFPCLLHVVYTENHWMSCVCLGSQTSGPWTSCIHIAFWPGSNLCHSHKVFAVLNSQQELNTLQTAQELVCRDCSLGSVYSQDPAGRTAQTHAASAAFPYMHICVHYLSKQAYLQKFHLVKARSIHHLRFVLHSWLLWYRIHRQRLYHDICLIPG